MAAPPASDPNRLLSAIPHLLRGPGGVAAVVHDGRVIAQRAWGYADLDRRIPMAANVLFPICSISKQMVCLTMLSLIRDPAPRMKARTEDPEQQMNAELRRMLPDLFRQQDGHGLTVRELSHMTSGIRDYWAMTTLWGARPDDPFSLLHDADQALARTKSFHFEPGTEYSYSNVNFHILGRILERVSGLSLAQLLVERVFIPAGMATAALCPNTVGFPLPVCGYEGNEDVGYFKSTNRIEWAGDAGIVASLDDMIAYEQFLERTWSDPNSLYAHASQQQTFRDGALSPYGYGLTHSRIAGKAVVGHAGAIRGFRLHRLHVPSEHLSVVVLLNHESDVSFGAERIAARILHGPGVVGEADVAGAKPTAEWTGDFLDAATQLYITVGHGRRPGTLSVRYARKGEVVKVTSATRAESKSMTLEIENDTLHGRRLGENRTLRATRIRPLDAAGLHHAPSAEFAGVYHCAESDSTFHCTGENGVLFGCFDGFVGRGPIWLMRYVGEDVWSLGNPRGLDATPPGDWTVVFKRGADKAVIGCTIGCWLARNVEYKKQA